MPLLAGTNYDPASAATASAASLIAMTALDTTNLRLTFNAPTQTYNGTNSAVLVRLRGTLHGATSACQVYLGVLEGATIRGRVAPVGGLKDTSLLATVRYTVEALYVVPGLTPGAALTWDAAYAVDLAVASSGIKYGGPDNATTNDAFGGFAFEIYDTPNLLGAILYDPASKATKATSTLLAMTALDTTNLRLTFVGPPSGKVLVRLKGVTEGGSTVAGILLGVLDGATIRGRQSPIGGCRDTTAVTTRTPHEASFVVTGLTPGTTYNWDAAYGVEIIGAGTYNLSYGGPDNTVTNDSAGAFSFEVWAL